MTGWLAPTVFVLVGLLVATALFFFAVTRGALLVRQGTGAQDQRPGGLAAATQEGCGQHGGDSCERPRDRQQNSETWL